MSRHHGRHLAPTRKTIAGSATVAASAAIGMTVSGAVAASAADAADTQAAQAPMEIAQAEVAPAAESFEVPTTDEAWSIAEIAVDIEEAPEPEPVVQPEAPAPAPEAAPARAAAPAAPAQEAAAPAPAAAQQAAPAPAPAPAAKSSVVGIARQYAGSAYRYGGTTPAGFDCSGFTSYVFAQVGVSLPRSSAAQRGAGVVVPASQAQPGDLLWWPGHVGIYTGNGQHIAARNPRAGVAEGPIYGNPLYIRVR